MSTSGDSEAAPGDGERVIDRSGDIDQRPVEERSGNELANAVSFKPPARRLADSLPVAPRYEAASLQSQRFQPPAQELADIALRLQKDLDKRYTKAKSQLDALAQKIEAQEKRCLPPKLDDD